MQRKKYQELKSLRVDSVISDTDDLRQKIDEHRRIQEMLAKEFRTQNEDLRNMIRSWEKDKAEAERLYDHCETLRSQLRAQDPVLGAFLRYPHFAIRAVGRRSFEIHAGDRRELAFSLRPSSSLASNDTLDFHFSEYPRGFLRDSETDFVREDGTVRPAALPEFCRRLCKGLQAAKIWTRQ
jgi:hypothetical protein